ncbi:MAG: preprotein translocase subunit SecY [Bacilli bacterium]|nr:preprotein translocase subunit SecY [Bacilli bacterium]MDD4809029.1 preprotein translocase subunit SecY [Bacilli bacterium]
MFAMIKQVFNPKNKDLQKRILFTLFVLFVFKLGTTIIVPGINKDALTGSLGFLELLNTMGGGAMERFSVFALGVMPYITASIIIQLLQMDIIPYLAELRNQGQTGRNKVNKITRVVGIIIAFIQGYLFTFAVIQDGKPLQHMEIALILTAGTAFLLWLGDQITQKGVGNGLSLIIMAGIIASMPKMFIDAWNGLVETGSTQGTALGIVTFVLFVLIYLAIILGIIYEQTAERRVPIQYANKSLSNYGGKQSYIPFKLNSAGVIPVIFASALISIPGIISAIVKSENFDLFVSKWLAMTSPTGLVLYVILIFGFCYFYTFVQLKPKEMADNLNKNGGYIPGIRPGEETVDYINKVLRRITFVGALALSFIAVLPILFGFFSNLPTSVTIGGTGLLIVVGVALETFKQVESQLVSRSYKRRKR